MKIRKFKNEDAVAVSKIMNKAFRSFLGDKMSESTRAGFSPKNLKKNSCVTGYDGKTVSFVAEERGRITGYISGSIKHCGLACLSVVGVDPDIASKGIGTALMKKLEDFCHRNKMRKIYTCVSAHNTKAMIYYIKNGFIPEGCQRDHFIEGVDEILLGKFLNEQ